jgi:hypothetical protein
MEEETMLDRPQARSEGIIDERVDDDLVLYDRETQTAHSLPAAAAMVWEHCDGTRSAAEIGDQLELETALVEQALAELGESGLLVDAPANLISRRQAAKRLASVGGAALAAPLIYSVAIGPATAAATAVACSNVNCTSSGGGNNGQTTKNSNTICQTSPACKANSSCTGAYDGTTDTYTGTCTF